MQEHVNGGIYTIDDDNTKKLQELLQEKCSVNTRFALIIYGNNGRPTIYEKVLQRVVVDTLGNAVYTLGKAEDDIDITLILDDDGEEYWKLRKCVSDKMQAISRDNSKFFHLPSFEDNNNLLIMRHPKKGRVLKVRVSTVPISLEKQVVDSFIEEKCPNRDDLPENDPHKTLKLLAMEYYDDDKEKLIRYTSKLLRDKAWVKAIVKCVQ